MDVSGVKTRDNNITVFPNPARESINMTYDLNDAQTVTIQLVSQTGRIILSQTIAGAEGMNNTKVSMPANIKPETYNLRVTGDKDFVGSKLVIVK